jgi:hypothetical protein
VPEFFQTKDNVVAQACIRRAFAFAIDRPFAQSPRITLSTTQKFITAHLSHAQRRLTA